MTNENQSSFLDELTFTDLHAHVGGSVPPHDIFEIAKEQGIRLPTKSYDEFIDQYVVHGNIKHKKYLDKFKLTQKIQSSPLAMEKSVYKAISNAYRNSTVRCLELRFNPILRNNDGYYDVDNIILSAIIGMKKAMMAYDINCGLIIETDRTFDSNKSEILAKKALRYQGDGIIGFDMSGHTTPEFNLSTHKEAFNILYNNGFNNITCHTGETTDHKEIKQVIKDFNVKRLGHGIKAAYDKDTMKIIKDKNIILEICPTSNLMLGVVKDMDELKFVLNTLFENDVKFTINTDGSEFLNTTVRNEYKMLFENGIFTKEQLISINQDSSLYAFN